MIDPGHTPPCLPPRLILAPMEGVVDAVMREQLTAIGGYLIQALHRLRALRDRIRPRILKLSSRSGFFFVMPLNCDKVDSLLQAPLSTFNFWALTPS